MSGETVSIAEAVNSKSEEDAQGRQRSKIAFPYEDLNSAIELVEALHGNVGLGECDDDQLAAWSKQSPKSSGFRIQIAAAKLFGLLETDGGKYKLTDLGSAVMDPNQARIAKAQAFMNVPLFRAIVEKYKGGVLPSQPAALEREIVGLGVSDKVKDRARQKFEKSAEQAGFFEHGKNRLVMPAGTPLREPQKEIPKPDDGDGNSGDFTGSGGGSGKPPTDIDPIIRGLLVRLPKSGEIWPEAERKLWLQLLEGSFKLIYKDASASTTNSTQE